MNNYGLAPTNLRRAVKQIAVGAEALESYFIECLHLQIRYLTMQMISLRQGI